MKADYKKRLLHRSKIIQGQIKGLEKMVEDESYCMDVITQSLAIQRSLGSFNKLMLEHHLLTHVSEKLASKDTRDYDKAIEELLGLYELSNVRSK